MPSEAFKKAFVDSGLLEPIGVPIIEETDTSPTASYTEMYFKNLQRSDRLPTYAYMDRRTYFNTTNFEGRCRQCSQHCNVCDCTIAEFSPLDTTIIRNPVITDVYYFE